MLIIENSPTRLTRLRMTATKLTECIKACFDDSIGHQNSVELGHLKSVRILNRVYLDNFPLPKSQTMTTFVKLKQLHFKCY